METGLKHSSNNLLSTSPKKQSNVTTLKPTKKQQNQRTNNELETMSLMSAKSGSIHMLNNLYKTGSVNMLNKVRGSNTQLNDTESMYSFATGTSGRHKVKVNEKDPVFTGLLKPRFVKREESEIFAIKFSPDNEYLIAACGNGSILVYSTKTNQIACTLPAFRASGQDIDLPATCIAFRPARPEFKNSQVMVVGYANGKLIHWHYPSGQKLASIQVEEGNEINTVDYSITGKNFAAAGTHPHIIIYDSKTQQQVKILDTGKFDVTAGHSSRIFSVKYHPKDNNILISGGWDNTIQFWNLETATSIKSIFNTYICGDSLDFNDEGDRILTGSYRKQDAIQIWNYETAKLETTVPWTILENHIERNCMIYTSKFSHTIDANGNPSNGYIIAGGSNPASNEVRIFLTQTKRCVGMIQNIPHSVFTSDISKNERMFACAGNGKTIFFCDVDPNLYNDFAY